MPIVCGTDLSDRSLHASIAAGFLAAKLSDGELWLVHVLDPAMRWLDEKAYAALEAATTARLETQAAQVKERARVRVQSAVLAGPAAATLLSFATTKEAQLLVVAGHGEGPAPLYRAGAIPEQVAQTSALPVLVLRDAAPFQAWANEERPLRVLLAVDWTRSCEGAIRWVRALRAKAPCDVIASFVYYSDLATTGARRYGLPVRHAMTERDPEAEALFVRDLGARVGELGGKGTVTFIPKHGIGRLGDHLLEVAEAERADLIVLGTHHRRALARLGSVAAVTLHYSHASVAIVPVGEHEPLVPDEVPCIRRVLVATDLSPLSNYAVPYGYTLLGERGGDVFLFHARPPKEHVSDSELIARLRALAPTHGLPGNVVTRTEVVHHANIAQAICEAGERLGVDALCLGSHGDTGFKRAILGSVVEEVLQRSRRPVFVVRPLPP